MTIGGYAYDGGAGEAQNCYYPMYPTYPTYPAPVDPVYPMYPPQPVTYVPTGGLSILDHMAIAELTKAIKRLADALEGKKNV